MLPFPIQLTGAGSKVVKPEGRLGSKGCDGRRPASATSSTVHQIH
jgi:hypothetical protein